MSCDGRSRRRGFRRAPCAAGNGEPSSWSQERRGRGWRWRARPRGRSRSSWPTSSFSPSISARGCERNPRASTKGQRGGQKPCVAPRSGGGAAALRSVRVGATRVSPATYETLRWRAATDASCAAVASARRAAVRRCRAASDSPRARCESARSSAARARRVAASAGRIARTETRAAAASRRARLTERPCATSRRSLRSAARTVLIHAVSASRAVTAQRRRVRGDRRRRRRGPRRHHVQPRVMVRIRLPPRQHRLAGRPDREHLEPRRAAGQLADRPRAVARPRPRIDHVRHRLPEPEARAVRPDRPAGQRPDRRVLRRPPPRASRSPPARACAARRRSRSRRRARRRPPDRSPPSS